MDSAPAPAPLAAAEKPLRRLRPAAESTLRERLAELYAFRELLLTFTLRELKVRYKQTLLGIAWAVVPPVFLTFIFTVIFSRFVGIASEGIPYAVFAYAGVLPWVFFSNSLTFATASVVTHAPLIERVYFPRAILPAAALLASLFDFAVAAAVFAGLLAYHGIAPTPQALFFPVILLIQVVFTFGIALFASALNVYYRDVRHAIPIVLQAWMYVTPVIYPASVVPERYRWLYQLNPMAGIIDGYRCTLVLGVAPSARDLSLAAAVAVVLCVLGYRYFHRVGAAFADVI